MNRGGRSGQPFQVSFTLENGHLPGLESQIINCSKFLMSLGVLSFKLNGHEVMSLSSISPLNGSEKSQSTSQSSSQNSLINTNKLSALPEIKSISGTSSPLAKESRSGRVLLKRDVVKPAPWKEEPAFRVPYPPQAVTSADDKMVQKNQGKGHEKTFVYPTSQTIISTPFDNIVNNNNNNNQLNGITKSRQSKRRKIQNETQLPYFHAQHTGYSSFSCQDLNPACNPSHFQMFKGKPFEQPTNLHLHHQVCQQMPLTRPTLETGTFYNHAADIVHHQMFLPHFQSDANYGFKQSLPESGESPAQHVVLTANDGHGANTHEDGMLEERRDEEEKFMDADSLARLIDSGEELPFSDCLDDLDGLLDFDLPEDLSVFETSCNPPNSGGGNPDKIFPDEPSLEENRDVGNGLDVVKTKKDSSPGLVVKERSRKRTRDDTSNTGFLESDMPECNTPKKSLTDDAIPSSDHSRMVAICTYPGNAQEIARHQPVASRSKEQLGRGSLQIIADSEKSSPVGMRLPENLLSSPVSCTSLVVNPAIPPSHLPCSAINNTVGLNSSPQSCFTPSQYASLQPPHGLNFSPSIASDSDGSPRLSTDDDRSSSGSKTASLLLSPPNWASDVSAPSVLEFYENSSFPRSDILTAEVGFTV